MKKFDKDLLISLALQETAFKQGFHRACNVFNQVIEISSKIDNFT